MTRVTFFGEAAEADRVGGKGASLSRLVAAGLPVPPGFCVPVDLLSAIGAGNPSADVDAAVERLGAAAVAVRSSAVGEDGTDASFAGIHLSVLNVPRTGVPSALGRVRESACTPAAMAYRARRGLEGAPRIAAVVQAMLVPDVSGVLFTRDPVTKADRFVVEASWGLGEAIVSGAVTPDHWELARSGDLVSSRIGDKDVAIVAEGEGTVEIEVEPARRGVPTLDASQLGALCDLARACERIFGSPQDIEFAWAAGQAWLLQSRPVTT